MELLIPETIRVLLPNGVVENLDLETYVAGVVAATLPPDAPLEALKAHAVAARTFGAHTRRHIDRGADVCAQRHCQVWQDRPSVLAVQAVEETRGLVATFDGRPIDAYYFEHCDGNTRDAAGVLIQAPSYLRSVGCVCGFATLKGHGIGMCLRGSLVMARFGESFDAILKHYYTGISLVRAGTGAAEARPIAVVPPQETSEPRRPRPAPARRVSVRPRPTHRANRPSVHPAPVPAEPAAPPVSEPTPPTIDPAPVVEPPAIQAEPIEQVEPGAAPVGVEESAEAAAPIAPQAELATPVEAEPVPATVEAAAPQLSTAIPELPPMAQEAPPIGLPEELVLPVPPVTPAPDVAPSAPLSLDEIEEPGWYPVADELSAGVEETEVELLDQALDAELEFQQEQAAAEEESADWTYESVTAFELESLPPDSMPEELPIFAPLEAPEAIEPPPLVEEEAVAAAVVAAPSVLVDLLPGPRIIAGDLTRPGIIVAIRDVNGNAVITVSGTAPHHGPGGFEALLPESGIYEVGFDGHGVQVQLGDETVFITYSA